MLGDGASYADGVLGEAVVVQVSDGLLTATQALAVTVTNVNEPPGITSNGESALLNIRGGSSDEVLFLIDGFPVRQAFHVPGHQAPFSSFDASLISTIDVYTGGFPLRYGERMSGVVDMRSLQPDQEFNNSVSASNDSVGARAAAE